MVIAGATNEEGSKNRFRIFPEHWRDLSEGSGLTKKIVREAGLFSVEQSEIKNLLGWLPPVQSALVFPYGCANFIRLKVFPPFKDHEGKTVKYLQPKDSSPRLYIPTYARKAVETPGHAFFITEGEKKALAACQRGLYCIAIGGVWNWMRNGQPIKDLDSIDWTGRYIGVVPDSDVWESKKSDLFHGVYAFGKELVKRGARCDLIIVQKGATLCKK